MQLLIARHAETMWNVEHRIQGWTDSKLTATGTLQARSLAERLRKKRLAAIYCSSSGRAITTAECIALWQGRDPIPMDDFRETSWGQWEGMTADEIALKYPDDWAKFRTKDNPTEDEEVETDSITYVPGGETIAEASKRINKGLDAVIQKHMDSDDPILIVGHGGSLRFLFTRAIGIGPSYAKRFHIDNTSLSEIHFSPTAVPVIHTLNDVSHLMCQTP